MTRRLRPELTSDGELLWYELRDWLFEDTVRLAQTSTINLTQWADPKLRLAKYVESSPVSVACVRLVNRASQLITDAKAPSLDRDTLLALEANITDGLKQFCVDPLGMSFADRKIKDFAALAFRSAVAARRSISPSTRIECYREAAKAGGIRCYVCGTVLATALHRHLNVPLDHLWPCAYGGSSDAVNLLPICSNCNSTKDNRITWDVFGVVNDYSLMKRGPNALLLTKMALHRKAAVKMAEDERITLKESFLKLGYSTYLTDLDPSDKNFFFNLRAHNPATLEDIW